MTETTFGMVCCGNSAGYIADSVEGAEGATLVGASNVVERSTHEFAAEYGIEAWHTVEHSRKSSTSTNSNCRYRGTSRDPPHDASGSPGRRPEPIVSRPRSRRDGTGRDEYETDYSDIGVILSAVESRELRHRVDAIPSDSPAAWTCVGEPATDPFGISVR